MPQLQAYYNEHAAQARQHETNRQQMTTLVIAINSVLVGLITYGKLSSRSWPAAAAIVIVGLLGYFAAAK